MDLYKVYIQLCQVTEYAHFYGIVVSSAKRWFTTTHLAILKLADHDLCEDFLAY